MKLAEWAEAYLRHRDVFERRLLGIAQEEVAGGTKLVLKRKDGVQTCLVLEELSGPPEELSTAEIVITKNRRANVEYLLKHWRVLAARKVKFVFANTARNEQWAIVPQHHERIVEKSPAKGVWALFQSVAEDDGKD